MTDMRLDVLIATYNRASLLTRTLESLLAAEQPAGLEVIVTIADNRSTNNTRAVVDAMRPRANSSMCSTARR